MLDGSEQGTPWHFVRQQKQFAIRKPLFERTFCASVARVWRYRNLIITIITIITPCTSASIERVFNSGGYLLGHTNASKAQCIDCGIAFTR